MSEDTETTGFALFLEASMLIAGAKERVAFRNQRAESRQAVTREKDVVTTNQGTDSESDVAQGSDSDSDSDSASAEESDFNSDSDSPSDSDSSSSSSSQGAGQGGVVRGAARGAGPSASGVKKTAAKPGPKSKKKAPVQRAT